MTISSSSSSSSPDKESIEKVFYEIRDQIQKQEQKQQNEETPTTTAPPFQLDGPLRSSLRFLHTLSTPRNTMDILALKIFSIPSNDMDTDDDNTSPATPLSSRDAFIILSLLVSNDNTSSSDYLIAASRAVKFTAEQIASSSSLLPTSVQVTDEVLSIIIAQLAGHNVEVSSNASTTLQALTKKLGKALSDKIIPSIVQTWKQHHQQQTSSSSSSSQSSTICIRCASTIIDLCCIGDAMMECALSSNAMNMLQETLQNDVVRDDPLMVMSVLDLMEKMANTLPMHGKRSKWLCSASVLNRLLFLAGGGGGGNGEGGMEEETKGENTMHDPILGGPALRLLSCLCRLAQRDESLFGEEENSTRQLLAGFHKALHSFDSNLTGELERLSFVDAVSSFASSSPDAMTIVLDDPILREGWLSLSVAQPKLKSVILHSVANSIDPPTIMDANGDSVLPWNVPSNQIAMRLFDTLGTVNDNGGDIHDDATKLVLTNANSPFVETRLGSYALLKAIAKRGVGAQVLLSHAGFFEFLTQRETSLETTKEGKEAKHDIVVAVLESDARGLLADDIVRKLEDVLRQGPHYVKAVPWELATE